MKVAFFSCNTDPGAGGLFYFEQAVLHALCYAERSFEMCRVHRGSRLESDLETQIIPVPRKPEFGQHDLESALGALKADYVWFLGSYEHSRWPYVFTTLDLAHRRYPDFPETSVFGWPYEEREKFHSRAIGRASAVVVGTATGAREITRYYQKPQEMLHVIPFFAPSFPEREQPVDVGREPFFLYPAQFWPHKNHVVLIDAMRELKRRGVSCRIILIGTDRGNLSFISQQIRAAALENEIKLLGFVSRAELKWLYAHAQALVFPTFFGPDNLPPLEAFEARCPVIASDIDGCRDQLGEAALLCPPDEPVAWANAMTRILNDLSLRENLIARGSNQLIGRKATDYVSGVAAVLHILERRRKCWGEQAPFLT